MSSICKTIILGIFAISASAIAQNAASVTMADAQKAYVAGNWKDAAANYEQVCATVADSSKTECYLWNVLALSQTGVAADFSKAGKRLDSLVQNTDNDKPIYTDLMMTKAQFQMYLGKYDKAAESLILGIDAAKPDQFVVLQKVCSAIQPRAKSAELDERCKKLKEPAVTDIQPADTTKSVAAPAEAPVPAQQPSVTPKGTASKVDTTKVAATPAPAVQPVTEPKKEQKAEVKEEPKQVAAPIPAAKDSNKPWILQLGAFGVKNNADLLVSNLKKRGIAAKIEERIGETKTLYLVFIPGFATKEEAVDYASKKLSPIKVDFQPILKK